MPLELGIKAVGQFAARRLVAEQEQVTGEVRRPVAMGVRCGSRKRVALNAQLGGDQQLIQYADDSVFAIAIRASERLHQLTEHPV